MQYRLKYSHSFQIKKKIWCFKDRYDVQEVQMVSLGHTGANFWYGTWRSTTKLTPTFTTVFPNIASFRKVDHREILLLFLMVKSFLTPTSIYIRVCTDHTPSEAGDGGRTSVMERTPWLSSWTGVSEEGVLVTAVTTGPDGPPHVSETAGHLLYPGVPSLWTLITLCNYIKMNLLPVISPNGSIEY